MTRGAWIACGFLAALAVVNLVLFLTPPEHSLLSLAVAVICAVGAVAVLYLWRRP